MTTRALLVAALLAGGGAGAGCYGVSPTACKITCTAGVGPCPSGQSCLADGFCHDGTSEPLCAALDAPAGGDAELPCTSRLAAIATGFGHACANDVAGGVWCWGANDEGQLGTGDTTALAAPTRVPGWPRARSVSAGAAHTCVVAVTGGVYCAGAGGGRLGDGTEAPSATPVRATGTEGATEVAAGGEVTCALIGETVRCTGRNFDGELGVGDTTPRLVPTEIPGLAARAIGAGATHACAVRTTGEVACWGDGHLGDGPSRQAPAPVGVIDATGEARVDGGLDHTCARTASGRVDCWGADDDGQVGDNAPGLPQPTAVRLGLESILTVAAGSATTCAVTTGGTAFCWGDGTRGQIGDGGAASRANPSPVTGLTGAVAVDVGDEYACAVDGDGVGWCWGRGDAGQLGGGGPGMGDALTPVRVDATCPP